MRIEILEGIDRLNDIRTLFREYASSLSVALCFQRFYERLGFLDIPSYYENPLPDTRYLRLTL